MSDEHEEKSDPAKPLPSFSLDEDASGFIDAPPHSKTSTSPPNSTTKAETPTTSDEPSPISEDTMPNTDPTKQDALPGEDPPPPPKKAIAIIVTLCFAAALALTFYRCAGR